MRDEMADHSQTIVALRDSLGDRLVTTAADLTLHGQNETYYPNTPPDAVAYPETTEEVSQILKICHAQGCPVVAYGAASSLEGQHLAVAGGISLDMSRMARVLSLDA
jgi:D-lactate dehydrogenase (cytochrome)